MTDDIGGTTKTQPWYMGERADAMALVHLTRRDDLVLTRQAADRGIDYLVDIVGEGRSGRRFGVQIKAARRSLRDGEAEAWLRSLVPDRDNAPHYPFPVCLLLLGVEDNSAHYAWVAEPVVTADGQPRLQVPEVPKVASLDRAAIDGIVQRVEGWYDVLLASLAA